MSRHLMEAKAESRQHDGGLPTDTLTLNTGVITELGAFPQELGKHQHPPL